ncbi:hypothetical protein Tco_0461572 [Tanacetum coccineum]
MEAIASMMRSQEVDQTNVEVLLALEVSHTNGIIASGKYKCSEEIITIAAMLSIGASIFCNPIVNENNARFHQGDDGGDHIALLEVYSFQKESNFSTHWCFANEIKVRSMEHDRDIRKQLEGLLKRVKIDLTSSNGYFPNLAKIHENGSYLSVKHRESVCIHSSSGLAKVIYHEIVLTAKEYMRQSGSIIRSCKMRSITTVLLCHDQDDSVGFVLSKLFMGIRVDSHSVRKVSIDDFDFEGTYNCVRGLFALDSASNICVAAKMLGPLDTSFRRSEMSIISYSDVLYLGSFAIEFAVGGRFDFPALAFVSSEWDEWFSSIHDDDVKIDDVDDARIDNNDDAIINFE